MTRVSDSRSDIRAGDRQCGSIMYRKTSTATGLLDMRFPWTQGRHRRWRCDAGLQLAQVRCKSQQHTLLRSAIESPSTEVHQHAQQCCSKMDQQKLAAVNDGLLGTACCNAYCDEFLRRWVHGQGVGCALQRLT